MKRTWQTHALLASALALTTTPLLAKSNKAVAPAVAPTTPEAPETLANLGDKKLLSELADRGLDSLLDRYFDLHKTPDAQQKAIRSMEGLRELSNPKLSNAEKQRKVKQVVEGITTTLPSITDPFHLAEDAGLLMLYGVTRDANLLEYWGDNPATAARLLPAAQAVYDMLAKASKESSDQAGLLAVKINVQNQAVMGAQWDSLSNLSQTAEYSQSMMAYYLALAMPPASRAPVVDKALKFLEDLDNPDSTVMPRVHVMMGKLNMVAGRTEDALKYLNAVATADKSLQPPPDPSQVYEAKYFSNVALLQAGKIDEAKKGLESLIAWQKTGMPTDAETQKGISAAAEMLRYRIFNAEAAIARDPAAKKAAQNSAVAVLLKLSESRPELRGIIYQQLVETLPKNAPVKEMDPLLLQGLMAKAYDEANKPPGTPVDQAVIQRGLAAAQEVANRKPGAILTPQMKDEASRLTPVLMEAAGHKIDAAETFLKYVQENVNVHRQYAEGALDDAGRLTFELRKTDSTDPRVSALYDAFLPVAINPPFNKVAGLAYLYGSRLAAEDKPAEALKYLHLVPKSDGAYNSAQYAMLKANQDLLNTPKLPEEQRARLANDLVHQAENVRETYSGKSDPTARQRVAIATLIEAETLGADLKKPAEALRLLTGFEDTVKGTPDEKALVTSAMLDRVNANVALNQLQAATTMLVALLNQTGGAQGATFVRGLLDRLDSDLGKAQAAHDTSAMRDIARSEAALSGFLVDWARNNSNPEIKKFTYQYMVFDARTQRLAGTLATDPKEKTALLEKAMGAYQRLQQQDNVALFKATLDPKKVASGALDPTQPDPNVQLGVGLTDFELKDYKGAAEILGNLLNLGKLGGPTLLITDPHGEDKVVQNDTYWEATYDLYASNVGAAKGPDDAVLAPTKQGLKNLLIRDGIPPKWQDPFDDLRKQIIPDFSVAALSDAPTTQPATSQPLSAR
jgi:tetratricopeptide (TPR) repeat protein